VIPPCPLTFNADDKGVPLSVKIQGCDIKVRKIVDSLTITSHWGQGHFSTRVHYDCLMSKGLRITLFQNLKSGL